MNASIKSVDELTIADLKQFAVWQFVNDEEYYDETALRPVKKTPVKSLEGCLVSTQVRLANGVKAWALLGNINASDPHQTQHLLSISVFRGGERFSLARYHDFDSSERSPLALAEFLGLPVDEVFPILYNVSKFCVGEPAALAGMIDAEPREKLTRAQIIALALK